MKKTNLISVLVVGAMLISLSCSSQNEDKKKEDNKAKLELSGESQVGTIMQASAGSDTLILTGLTPESQDELASYYLGISVASSMKQQQVPLQIEYFAAAVQQVLSEDPNAKSPEEANMFLRSYFEEFQQRIAADNLAKGNAFLAENKTQEGVVTLASGLQYKVLREGTGAMPVPGDQVKCHYRGTLLDGTEFDSSYKRGEPATFPVTGVIKGWIEGLQLMKTGAKWMLYIPSDLAYGERGNPSIGANSTLIFEIELLEIIPQATE